MALMLIIALAVILVRREDLSGAGPAPASADAGTSPSRA
jgi:hypothetical protein